MEISRINLEKKALLQTPNFYFNSMIIEMGYFKTFFFFLSYLALTVRP